MLMKFIKNESPLNLVIKIGYDIQSPTILREVNAPIMTVLFPISFLEDKKSLAVFCECLVMIRDGKNPYKTITADFSENFDTVKFLCDSLINSKEKNKYSYKLILTNDTESLLKMHDPYFLSSIANKILFEKRENQNRIFKTNIEGMFKIISLSQYLSEIDLKVFCYMIGQSIKFSMDNDVNH